MTPPAGGGAGDLDMSFENASTILNGIQVPIDGWEKVWKAALVGIRADEGKLNGFDDISTAFRKSYNAAEPSLTERTLEFPARIRPAVETGLDGLAAYQATREAITDGFDNVK